jgi:hypothetical protein
MSRVLSILLCVNIIVTLLLFSYIRKVTIQIQDAKDSLNSAVEVIRIIQTTLGGGIVDKAQLVKRGFDHIKEAKILTHLKDKFFNGVE